MMQFIRFNARNIYKLWNILYFERFCLQVSDDETEILDESRGEESAYAWIIPIIDK